MKLISEISELRKVLESTLQSGREISLVPTMGALHSGHLSLVETALKTNDLLIVTIFVNPTQFNDPKDLDRYPRTLEADLALLSDFPVDIVFAPDVKEMYPETDTRIFNLSPLDSVMEGKHRPGHFNGVAQIVSKLFDVTSAHRAYFGQKDFQQLAIIRHLVQILKMNIEIIACPIIREADGLAMSSRNQLLSSDERQAAPLLFKTLEEASKKLNKYSPRDLEQFVINQINQNPLLQVEYFEIVDDQSLMPIKQWSDSSNKIGCIAVQIGKIRIIDNKYFN